METKVVRSRGEDRQAASLVDDRLYATLLRLLLLAGAIVVVLWILHAIRQAVLLLILAVILTLVLNAPITRLERTRLSRGVSTAIVLASAALLVGLLGWLVVPRLVEEIPTLVTELPAAVQEQGRALAAAVGIPEIDQQAAQLARWMERAVGEVWRIADTIAAAFLGVLFVVAMVLYMVSDPRPMMQWYVRTMPAHLREPAVRAFHRSAKMVVGWVIANAIMGAIKATASFIFLSLMEVPGALVWSLLAAFAALIPRIGFYLMAIPPVLVSLTVSPTTALWTLLFFWALSEFLGNFVAPRVQGEIMELHPAYLLFMALAMGLAFGLLGVLVSSPVAGFLKTYYDEFYLARQPEDPELDERVEEMMEGSLEGARGMKRAVGG